MVYKCLYILAVLLICCSGNRFSGIYNKHPLKRSNLAYFNSASEDHNFNVVPSINEYTDVQEPSCSDLRQWWRYISALIRASPHNNKIEDISYLRKVFASNGNSENIGEAEVVPEIHSFGTFKDNDVKAVHRKTPEAANFASLGFGGFEKSVDDSPQDYGEYANEAAAFEDSSENTGFGGFGGFDEFEDSNEKGGAYSKPGGHFSNDVSGCKDVESKTCSKDNDCNCLGFYHCHMSKCHRWSSSGKATFVIGKFHDTPIDLRGRRTVNK